VAPQPAGQAVPEINRPATGLCPNLSPA